MAEGELRGTAGGLEDGGLLGPAWLLFVLCIAAMDTAIRIKIMQLTISGPRILDGGIAAIAAITPTAVNMNAGN